MAESFEEKSWNQRLREWYKQSGMTLAQIQEKTSIPQSTFRDYLKGRTIDLRKVSQERRQALCQLTGYEFFIADETELTKYCIVPTDKKNELLKESDSDLTKILVDIEKNLYGIKLSLAQQLSSPEVLHLIRSQYSQNSHERMRTVETAIDILVEQVDYFRTTSQSERVKLVKYLKELGEIERWGYVVNIVDNLTKTDGIPDTFLRSMNPPKKIDNKINK